MKKVNHNSTKTVLVITVGFLVVFLITNTKWCIYISLIIGALGILSNKVAYFIDYVWMKLAKVLSYIVPNILLSIVFFCILFPIAVLEKLFSNKNKLQLKNNSATLWISRVSKFEKSSFKKMW